MPATPNEEAFRVEGDLCFAADAPALAHIGKGFQQLTDRWFNQAAPPAELDRWRRLAGELRKHMEQAAVGKIASWSTLEKELANEFGDYFTLASGRVAGPVHEFHQTGQMPVAEYLEHLLWGAESMWLNSGGGEELDMEGYLARTNRLSRQMQTADYESETDRRMRQDNPERYEFLTKSMKLMLDSMDDPDPQAVEKMTVEQMKLFRQSPLFEQAKDSMLALRKRLEPLRESEPELYQQQIQAIEQMERFAEDPASVLQEQLAALQPGVDEGSEDEDDEETPTPGRLRFNCGRNSSVNSAHVALFQQFMDHQESLRVEIEESLRKMHADMQAHLLNWPAELAAHMQMLRESPMREEVEEAMRDGRKRLDAARENKSALYRHNLAAQENIERFWHDPAAAAKSFHAAVPPGDRALFPDDPDKSDIPLQCFRIRQVKLQPERGGCILLDLDTQFDYFDERGCHILIQGGHVRRYGTAEDVFGDKDNP